MLAMSITSALGYSAFSVLFKAALNTDIYINLPPPALGTQALLALYLTGSSVMLLSTATIFEYGAHYFADKMRIIKQKHERSKQSKTGNE